jgi:hypothetical protein
MPLYEISTSGGLFTSTSTWVGGVVPPSATSSDIYGATTSGPLSFQGLTTRTIGSFLLSDYQNIITMTGSSMVLTIGGPTLSLNTGMTVSTNGIGSSYRFLLGGGSGLSSQKVFSNGHRVRFGFYIQNTVPTYFNDDLTIDEGGWFMINSSTGQISSITASERFNVIYDPVTSSRPAYLQMPAASTLNTAYHYLFNVWIRNTTSSSNYVAISSQAGSGALGWGQNVYIDGGDLRTGSSTLKFSTNFHFEYISGTVSGTNIGFFILPNTAGASQLNGTSSIKTDGINWKYVGVYHVAGNQSLLQFQNNFSCEDFYTYNSTTYAANRGLYLDSGTWSFQVNDTFSIANAQIFTNAGISTFPAYNIWFKGGSTYSIKELVASAQVINETDITSNKNIISGTGGSQANLNIQDLGILFETDVYDINATNQPIYCLVASQSGNTNVFTSLPTGGGGEYSNAYIG